MKKHEHTVRLTDEEEFVIWAYAQHTHITATNLIPAFLTFAAFGWIKKYPIKSASERRRLVEQWILKNNLSNAEAVQLLAILGKSEED